MADTNTHVNSHGVLNHNDDSLKEPGDHNVDPFTHLQLIIVVLIRLCVKSVFCRQSQILLIQDFYFMSLFCATHTITASKQA